MKLLSVIVAVLFLIPCNPALSQTLPSCSSIAQDADGDGFGWVINPTETRLQEGLAVPHSCVVDESTETTPVLINRETGIEIPLVRQYWNANVDLAGKTLQCERYSFNIQSNRYDLAFSYQRFHHQLPDKKPYFGIWERSNEFTYNRDGEPIRAQQDGRDLNFVWSVVDGVLIDSLRISERNNLDARDYWVELVSVNGGVNNATRFWGESTSSYYQCTDPATNRFVPTGTPGAAGAAVSDFSEASLIFTSVAENPPPASPYRYGADGPNEVADGPEAILSNGIMWDIQNLAYIRIECPLYFEETLGSGENSFFGWRYDDPKDYTLMFLPPMNDSPRSGFLIVDFQHSYSAARAVRWSIANDNTISNSLLGSQDWFELASNDNGNDILRYWQTNGGLRICELEQLQYDSAFDRRPTTQDEYDNWLIKTNVDTSHCTTAENAYPLTVRNNSCLVDANEQNVPTLTALPV